MTTEDKLKIALSAAVPLCIREMKKVSWEERMAMRPECAKIIGEKGADLFYMGHKPGDTARAFGAVARAIAVLSFAPGGVTAFGLHFETKEEPPC